MPGVAAERLDPEVNSLTEDLAYNESPFIYAPERFKSGTLASILNVSVDPPSVSQTAPLFDDIKMGVPLLVRVASNSTNAGKLPPDLGVESL